MRPNETPDTGPASDTFFALVDHMTEWFDAARQQKHRGQPECSDDCPCVPAAMAAVITTLLAACHYEQAVLERAYAESVAGRSWLDGMPRERTEGEDQQMAAHLVAHHLPTPVGGHA